jgi:hypothetical protein
MSSSESKSNYIFLNLSICRVKVNCQIRKFKITKLKQQMIPTCCHIGNWKRLIFILSTHLWAVGNFYFSDGNLYFFFCSTLSEFENFLLCERILINDKCHKWSKRNEANFQDFKGFRAFQRLVEQKNVVLN